MSRFMIFSAGNQKLLSVDRMSTVIMIRLFHIIAEILRVIIIIKGKPYYITSIWCCPKMQQIYACGDMCSPYKVARQNFSFRGFYFNLGSFIYIRHFTPGHNYAACCLKCFCKAKNIFYGMKLCLFPSAGYACVRNREWRIIDEVNRYFYFLCGLY